MRRPIFIFKNSDGVEYRVYYGKPTFSYRKNGKTIYLYPAAVCYSPKGKKPRIIIKKKTKEKTNLHIILEEFAHAFFWDKKEREVRPFASSVTKFLYKQGWRKIK